MKLDWNPKAKLCSKQKRHKPNSSCGNLYHAYTANTTVWMQLVYTNKRTDLKILHPHLELQLKTGLFKGSPSFEKSIRTPRRPHKKYHHPW